MRLTEFYQDVVHLLELELRYQTAERPSTSKSADLVALAVSDLENAIGVLCMLSMRALWLLGWTRSVLGCWEQAKVCNSGIGSQRGPFGAGGKSATIR